MKIIKTEATLYQEKIAKILNKIEKSGYFVSRYDSYMPIYIIKEQKGLFRSHIKISLWKIEKNIIELKDFTKGFRDKIIEQGFINKFEKKTKIVLTKFV